MAYYNDERTELGNLLTSMSNKSRMDILKTLFEEEPLVYSAIASKIGYKINSNRSQSGKFGFHLRNLKEFGLIYQGKDKKYSLTQKGHIAFTGINMIFDIYKDIGNDDLSTAFKDLYTIKESLPEIERAKEKISDIVGNLDKVLINMKDPKMTIKSYLKKIEERPDIIDIKEKPIITDIDEVLSKYNINDINEDEREFCKFIIESEGTPIDHEKAAKELLWTQRKYEKVLDNLVSRDILKKSSQYQENDLVYFYNLKPQNIVN